MSLPTNQKMIIEGFALQDNIIAVTHRQTNGNDGPNLHLRAKVITEELEQFGFFDEAVLADKTSGKDDKPLVGSDGMPIYLFLSFNTHTFDTVHEAHSSVITQCQ
jgi:hypothetical protein